MDLHIQRDGDVMHIRNADADNTREAYHIYTPQIEKPEDITIMMEIGLELGIMEEIEIHEVKRTIEWACSKHYHALFPNEGPMQN